MGLLDLKSKTKKENVKMEEKLMTKADLEGMELKCVRSRNCDYLAGNIYTIKNQTIKGEQGRDELFSWYQELPNKFTMSQLTNKVNKYEDMTFEVLSKKSTKSKTPTLSTKVNVKVDLLFDSPVEETHKDGKFIIYGRMVMFIKNDGNHGMAVCNSNELKSYDVEIGKAIAYWRANQ